MIPPSDNSEIVNTWKKIPAAFYQQTDVVAITKELIGKLVVTNFSNQLTAGRIVEAEAYNGPFDKASHSYNNRRTGRTEIMYAEGGVAYVYLCYGIHQMFNIVTNIKDVPNAILIRAVQPVVGVETMLRRSGKAIARFDLTRGPGNVARVLGIHTSHNGLSLQSDELYIAEDGFVFPNDEIIATKRIGVDYAAEDALLPYRFIVGANKYVSGKNIL